MTEILHANQLTADHIANSTVDQAAAWTWDHTPRGGWSIEQLRKRDDGHYGADSGVIDLGHVDPQRVLDEITAMVYAYETRFLRV